MLKHCSDTVFNWPHSAPEEMIWPFILVPGMRKVKPGISYKLFP